MKIKNNKSADELVDLILEVRDRHDGTSTRYAYATGVLITIMDWARSTGSIKNLQDEINNNYELYEKELQALQLQSIQKVKKPEPLTAVTDYPTD
jgi:hypothetical protein